MRGKTRLAVLLSGRGSNFLAIQHACARGDVPAEVVVVVSNKSDAAGIQRARELHIPAYAIDHKHYPTREAHEAEVIRVIDEHAANLVVLAGYMRLLSPIFVGHFRHRITNIHPSLLPAFPGVDAQKQALDHGVKVAGCTVHLVDESLDGGPILVQRAVPVLDDDTEESLAARILGEEHSAYVEAIGKLCRGFEVEGRRVRFRG